MIEAPVTVTEIPSEAIIRIAPAHNARGHDQIIQGAQKAKPRTSNKAKVARPPNAFILYRQHHHPLVKAEYPNLHNNQICEYFASLIKRSKLIRSAVILGSQWKQESAATKEKFASLATCLKAKHLQEHPGYQYQPRKSSEKKRRQTRKITKNENALTGLTATSSLTLQSDPDDKGSSNSGTSGSQMAQVAAVGLPGGLPAAATLDFSTVPSLAPGSTNPAPSTTNSGVFVSPFEISRTATGNAVFELGDEDLDDDQLAAILEEYNQTVPPALTPQAIAVRQNATPVLYNEPTEDAQDDTNFYSALVDYDEIVAFPRTFDDYFDFQAASLQSPKS